MSLQTAKNDASRSFDYPSTAKFFNFMHFQLGRRHYYNIETELITRNIFDLEYFINELINMGVPSTKILIAINFGGFEMLSPDDLKQHIAAYNYICFNIIFKNLNLTYNSDVGVGVAKDMKNNTIYLIESGRVIANKIRYAMRKNLAGVLITGTGSDDYENRCDELDHNTYADYKSLVPGVTLNIPIRTKKLPFFSSIVNEAFVVALDEIEQEKKAKNTCFNQFFEGKL